MKLDDAVQFLKGVGPRRAEALEKSGLRTVEDLLYRLPYRYEDRRHVGAVSAAESGRDMTFVGKIAGLRDMRRRGRRGGGLRAILSDDSGWIGLLWFNQATFFREKTRIRHNLVRAWARGARTSRRATDSTSGDRVAGS